MLLLVVISLAVTGAFAQGGHVHGPQTAGIDLRPYNVTALGLFRENDLNNDTILSRKEFETVFAQYDFNKDKIIERHEYVCYITTDILALTYLAHALFDVYDVNHDHKLQVDDYDNFFKLMDTNGDGSVSQNEFVEYWTNLLQHTEQHSLHGHPHPLHHDHYCDDHMMTTGTTVPPMMTGTTVPPMTTGTKAAPTTAS